MQSISYHAKKAILPSLFILLSISAVYGQDSLEIKPPPPSQHLVVCEILVLPEVLPKFPQQAYGYADSISNDEALLHFIYQNIRYTPKMSSMWCVEGTVVVSFTVMKAGKIEDVRIIRGIQKDYDEEVLRVINLLADGPAWEPARDRERAVRYQMNIPVRFPLRRPSK